MFGHFGTLEQNHVTVAILPLIIASNSRLSLSESPGRIRYCNNKTQTDKWSRRCFPFQPSAKLLLLGPTSLRLMANLLELPASFVALGNTFYCNGYVVVIHLALFWFYFLLLIVACLSEIMYSWKFITKKCFSIMKIGKKLLFC